MFARPYHSNIFTPLASETNQRHHRFHIIDVPLQTILDKEWKKGLRHIWIIYNAACRFKINAYTRCATNPFSPLHPDFQRRLIPDSGFIEYKVNAFHQHSHKPECADAHSIRNTSNIGMVTGEEIETAWAKLNHIQYSLREMDAGGRIDMITIHMLEINKDKIDRMGQSLSLTSVLRLTW